MQGGSAAELFTPTSSQTVPKERRRRVLSRRLRLCPDAAGRLMRMIGLITVCRRAAPSPLQNAGLGKKETKSAHLDVGKRLQTPTFLLRFFGPFVRRDLARKLELNPSVFATSVTKRFELDPPSMNKLGPNQPSSQTEPGDQQGRLGLGSSCDAD